MQLARAIGTAALLLLFGTGVPVYAQQGRQNEKQAKPDRQQARKQGQQAQQQPQQQAQRTQQAQQQQRQQVQRTQQAQQQPQQQVQRTQQAQQQPRQQAQRTQQAQQQQRQQVQRTQQAQQQQRQRMQQQQQAQRFQRGYQQRPQRTRQQAVAWQQQRGWVQQGGGWQGHGTWQQSRVRNWENEHRTWAQRGGYGGYYIPWATFSLSFGNQHWFRMQSRPTMYMGYPRFSYGGYSFLLVDPWPESWGDNWYDRDDLYISYDNGYYLYNRRYPSVGLALTVVM